MAQLTPRSGVIVFCTKDDTTYLLLVKYNNEHDVYDIPRGHVEENESPFDAAIRELYEETNVKCKPRYKAGIYEYSARSRRNGVLIHYPIHIYSCIVECQKEVYSHDKAEVEKTLWVPLDKAFKLITNKDLIKYMTQSFIYFHKRGLL